MRNKKKQNPLFKIFILVSSLLFITIVIAIGMFYYVFGITEPEGLSLASWPERFTDNFSVWMENDNSKIRVKEIGLERLDEYGLWLQVIDETGKEVFCHNKPEKGVFGEIYGALNKMDERIHRSDKAGLDTERIRREWIANITHDLKTPLSQIKGYAELLMNSPVPDGETVQEYGEIILKNANHTEKMIDDLKLTYQLDSGAVPYHPQAVRLVRFLKGSAAR